MARSRPSISPAQRRRNEWAQLISDGQFKNYYQWRKAMEAGQVPAARPERITNAKTRRAQTKSKRGSGFYNKEVVGSKARAAKPRTKKLSHKEKAELCRDWSKRNAVTTVFRYDIGLIPPIRRRAKNDWLQWTDATVYHKQRWIDEHGIEAYTDLYYRAFVDNGDLDRDDSAVGSPDLEKWLTEVTQYQQADEYESRYGPN